jgi:hypothetical protein
MWFTVSIFLTAIGIGVYIAMDIFLNTPGVE